MKSQNLGGSLVRAFVKAIALFFILGLLSACEYILEGPTDEFLDSTIIPNALTVRMFVWELEQLPRSAVEPGEKVFTSKSWKKAKKGYVLYLKSADGHEFEIPIAWNKSENKSMPVFFKSLTDGSTEDGWRFVLQTNLNYMAAQASGLAKPYPAEFFKGKNINPEKLGETKISKAKAETAKTITEETEPSAGNQENQIVTSNQQVSSDAKPSLTEEIVVEDTNTLSSPAPAQGYPSQDFGKDSARYYQLEDEINRIWKALPKPVRQANIEAQRAFNKAKEENCHAKALADGGKDVASYEAVRQSCWADMYEIRIPQLLLLQQ